MAGSCNAAGSFPCSCPQAHPSTAHPRRCLALQRKAPASRRA
jgi:hypothetical protein